MYMEPTDPFLNPQLCPTDSMGTNTRGARFGCSRDGSSKWHGGIDLKAEVGTKFAAIYSGTVSKIRDLEETDPNYKKGVGNFIIVKSQNFSVKYCHLSEIDVEEEDDVVAGMPLGKTGKSGNAYPDSVPFKHLHIEVSTDHFLTANNYVNPEPYLKTTYPQPLPAINQDKTSCG
jgi:murein DD-endopeptidase MepM/ murein hydrolase activator NlpD